MYLLSDKDRAVALCQQVFLDVVSNADSFHLEMQFRPWLYGFFHRRWLPLQAEAEVTPTDGPIADVAPLSEEPRVGSDPSAAGPPSSRAYRSQLLARRVLERLQALSTEGREILLLKLVANLRLREIAQATGLQEDAVRSKLRHALERMQEAVSDTEEYARALR